MITEKQIDEIMLEKGILTWLNQVGATYRQQEDWDVQTIIAFAIEAAKEGIAAGWEACLMNEQIEMRVKNERL